MGDGIWEKRQCGRQQAHVELLALTGAEPMGERRARDAEGEEGGSEVSDGATDLRRRVSRHPGERHDAAHPLGDRVVARPPGVRAGLTEARHRDVDDRRIHAAHRDVAEPELVGDARKEVLDDDIGSAGQLEHELAALGLLEIHGDAALVTVDRREGRTHPVASPRP